ncbi:MAG: hypothetical protein NTX84_05260 [Nitrospirae bacterium]|nr:hypothetical protein [Nitrospirota bacterium]
MKMQNPVTSTLEQVMKNPDAYLFVLVVTLLLAAPIVRAIQTLLAMRARVIVPLLRVQTGQQFTTMIASVRTIEAVLCPHCASSVDHHIDVNPTTVTQPREAL